MSFWFWNCPPLVTVLLLVSENLSGEVTFELRLQRSPRARQVRMWGRKGRICNGPDVGAGCDLHHLLLDAVARGHSREKDCGFSNSSPPMHAD